MKSETVKEQGNEWMKMAGLFGGIFRGESVLSKFR